MAETPKNKLSWDERYRRGEHADVEPDALLRRAINGLKPGRALDVACGAGRNALFLAEHGWLVTAVDASKVAIEITRQRAKDRGLTIDARVADLESGEFSIEPETFDLICIFYYLQRNLFHQVREGLKPAGTFVAAIHLSSEDPAIDKGRNPAFLLRPGELAAEFPDWDRLHYSETTSEDSPSGHGRRAAEIIAKKFARPSSESDSSNPAAGQTDH